MGYLICLVVGFWLGFAVAFLRAAASRMSKAVQEGRRGPKAAKLGKPQLRLLPQDPLPEFLGAMKALGFNRAEAIAKFANVTSYGAPLEIQVREALARKPFTALG
jgi:hypothetical protein